MCGSNVFSRVLWLFLCCAIASLVYNGTTSSCRSTINADDFLPEDSNDPSVGFCNPAGDSSWTTRAYILRLLCSPLTADRQANITSMLGQQADRVMALGEWEERWQQNKIGFHQPEVHKMLKKNIDKVLNGRTGVRFFFPLCGKAVDMKWLADMGHSVVGVEISEKAIRQFFEENNMTYTEEPVPAIPGAKVYKNSEKNISLYQCNLYNFSNSIEGQFGAIWDRGSLVAINPGDREKYAALIISLMANDCRYLLDTLLYNPDLYQGPPFFVPDEQVHSLFGSSCGIELLQSEDALTDKQRNWGLDKFLENVHLITPKSN
ncbi:probable thiopurine S-methyltransferase isoform X2 [Simochromis diagramma]|uniref:probable thiopurine S-methyltransferase isoform X2 n=1 Tax=Simochromis diagramma TaxID=43689 RepID=UPI001A7E82CE|nr:probable thiopurine S-methyltransferase isoform X2 [Simochromis diagramma]